jgi:hypothetical protein
VPRATRHSIWRVESAACKRSHLHAPAPETAEGPTSECSGPHDVRHATLIRTNHIAQDKKVKKFWPVDNLSETLILRHRSTFYRLISRTPPVDNYTNVITEPLRLFLLQKARG